MRDITLNGFYLNAQGTRARVALALEMDLPGGMVTVSDNAKCGRPIVLEWGEIAPLLVEDDGIQDAQSFQATLSNRLSSGSRVADLLSASGVEGVECRLYACDPGPDAASSVLRLLVFRGRLQQVGDATVASVTVTVDGRGAYFARSLDRLVRDTWPQAPETFAGRLQQILYGRVTKWLPIPVDVGIVAELDEAMTSSQSTATVKDDVSRWGSSGVVQLGGSELASYAGKNTDTRQITGLVRGLYGTPVSAHPAGSLVFERLSTFKFEVADGTYGPIGGVREVRIGGRKVAAARWSQDTAAGTLSITPATRVLGRPTYNRVQLVNRGLVLSGQPTAQQSNSTTGSTRLSSAGIRMSADNLQTRPITNPAHGALVPWRAPASDYFWPAQTDATAASGDKGSCTSTVKLMPNTAKTWEASYFESYLPPSGLLIRTGFSVGLSVMPALRRAWSVNGGFEMKSEIVKLLRIDCTVGGVTKSWSPSGDDAFSNPAYTSHTSQMGLGRPIPIQHIEFPFTPEEVDPEGAPYAVTIQAITESGVTSHACRVQSLVQSIDGVLPWSAPTGACQASLSTDAPVSDEVTLTFASTYELAVLAIAFRAACDYVKVDLGGGRVVRFQPQSIDDGVMHENDVSGRVAAWMTATVLIQNPPTEIKIQARDFGRDTQAPVVYTAGDDDFLIVGGATLMGLTTGSAQYPLLREERHESVFLATFGAYPEADCEGYVTAAGALIEHPCDVVEHFLTEVLGEASADVSVREDRATWPSYYKFAGGIVTQEDVRVFLVQMARSARARIRWDGFTGQWRMRWRKTPATIQAAAANFTWGDGNRLPGHPALSRTSDTDLPTKVNVRWLRDWSMTDGLDAYLVEPSGSGSRTKDERYLMPFVRNKQMAADLASFYAAWDTVATRRTALLALVAHVNVEEEDVVALSLPVPGSSPLTYLQSVQDKKFIVRATGLRPHGNGSPMAVPVLLIEVPS